MTRKPTKREEKPKRKCARPGCEHKFHPYRDSQEYCSGACRQAAFVARQKEELAKLRKTLGELGL